MGPGGSCASSKERRWSTDGLPVDEQFSYWRETISSMFVPLEAVRDGAGAFAGRIHAREVGPVGVARIVSEPQRVLRTDALVARRAGDVFYVNYQLRGIGRTRQGGPWAETGPGDFVVVDSTRPFELAFDRGPFRQICFTLPHDLLAPRLAAPEACTGIGVPGARGVGAVASTALRCLAVEGGHLDRAASRAVAEHVSDLVADVLGRLQAPPATATRRLLLQAALDEVERGLGDRDFSPRRISERLGISTRYVHALFAERGTTCGRWVLRRRLDRARTALADPARAHWTVAEVALEHGFRDPAYFARAFRARYGLSPREHRRAAHRLLRDGS